MADQQAVLKTNRGDITINLFPNHAPETVGNFVGLAEGTKEYRDDAGRSGQRYYDGLVFHRIIDGFMIQGGCPLGTGSGGPGYTIKDEVANNARKHLRGTLSMAKTAAPDSGGSQFFICHTPQPHLDRKHTVFGQVVSGQEVVDAIKQGDKMNKVWIEEKP